MKAYYVAIFLAVWGSQIDIGHAQGSNTIVNAADIGRTVTVIGRLGLPMGTVTTIKAVVVDGSETGSKADQSSYLLKVSSVGGKELTNPVVIHFWDRTDMIKNCDEGETRRNVPGRSLCLLAYEDGGFRGEPRHLPKNFPARQDTGFSFQTHLAIVKVLKDEPGMTLQKQVQAVQH